MKRGMIIGVLVVLLMFLILSVSYSEHAVKEQGVLNNIGGFFSFKWLFLEGVSVMEGPCNIPPCPDCSDASTKYRLIFSAPEGSPPEGGDYCCEGFEGEFTLVYQGYEQDPQHYWVSEETFTNEQVCPGSPDLDLKYVLTLTGGGCTPHLKILTEEDSLENPGILVPESCPTTILLTSDFDCSSSSDGWHYNNGLSDICLFKCIRDGTFLTEPIPEGIDEWKNKECNECQLCSDSDFCEVNTLMIGEPCTVSEETGICDSSGDCFLGECLDEICDDEIDNDCDGLIDCDDSDCGSDENCIECTSDPECDDENLCNGQETCVSGVCESGTPVECGDTHYIDCWLDETTGIYTWFDETTHFECNPADGLCEETGADEIEEVCDDDIGCTTDSCDPNLRCVYIPLTDCINDDGCCSSECDSSNDNDCECIPNWRCNEWSACVDNEKTRECEDENDCGTHEGEPDETKSCGVVPSDDNGGSNRGGGDSNGGSSFYSQNKCISQEICECRDLVEILDDLRMKLGVEELALIKPNLIMHYSDPLTSLLLEAYNLFFGNKEKKSDNEAKEKCFRVSYFKAKNGNNQECWDKEYSFDEVDSCDNNCGNGIVETGKGEKCDDGNNKDGDGCDRYCKIECSPEACEECGFFCFEKECNYPCRFEKGFLSLFNKCKC